MDDAFRTDTRLVPAVACAWGAALLGLAFHGTVALALSGFCGALAYWRRSLPLALGAAAAAAVATSSLLLAAHAATLTSCNGTTELRGRVLQDPTPGGLGADYAARTRVAVVAVRCGGAQWQAAGGTAVALGDVGDLTRDAAVRLRGSAQAAAGLRTDQVLVFDAEVLATNAPTGLHALVSERRERFRELTSQLSAAGAGLVPGIALGDDTALPQWLDQAMKRSSLSHLTAVSGSHVVLVLALVGAVVVRAPPLFKAGALLAVLAALVLVVGPEASVVRAVAMGIVGVIAMARRRPAYAIPALAAGVVVLLVVDPTRAASYGFALSTATSAALVVGVPAVVRRVDPAHPRLRLAAAWLAVPALAQLAAAPILVLFQPAVSVWGVAANLAAAPAVPVATVGALAAFVLQPLPLVTPGLLAVADLAARWVAHVATVAAHAPYSTLTWPEGPAGAAVLLLVEAAAISALWHLHGWKPRAVAASMAAGACLWAWWAGQAPEWDVWQCDVGQGAATLVNAGNGTAVMVDVGSAGTGAERCLQRAGVREIAVLVLTHPHEDHVGNLAAVLAAVNVERAVISPASGSTAQAVAEELATAGVPVTVGTAGVHGQAGVVQWQVLWPVDGSAPADANDASVIVRLEGPDGVVLPLGDLSTVGQQALLQSSQSDAVRSDVVVVAHHGSADQYPPLVAAVGARVAVVPVGENSYGHPAQDTLARYEGLGARVYRTDTHGDVVLDVVHVGGQ